MQYVMYTVERRREISLEVEQFTKQIVHLCVAEGSLDFHVLHDLESDGLERSQSQEKFGESLRGNWVDALGSCLERLENLFLVYFNLLSGGRAESFSICRGKNGERRSINSK